MHLPANIKSLADYSSCHPGLKVTSRSQTVTYTKEYKVEIWSLKTTNKNSSIPIDWNLWWPWIIFWGHFNVFTFSMFVTVWLSGSALASINEVTLRRARLVLRWMTGSGFNSQCRKAISVYNQPPRSTQPGHPLWVGNECQPKGGDALRLGSKGRYGSWVGGM